MKKSLVALAQPPVSLEPRFSVDFQSVTTEEALQQLFTRAGISFVIPDGLLEMVTLSLKQQTLATLVGRLLEQSPDSLRVQIEQGIWQVLPASETRSGLISLELRTVPLRAALLALQPYLSGLRLTLEGVSPTIRVTYSRSRIRPRQALAEILKRAGPGVSAEVRKPGELVVRLGEPAPFTGRLDLDFRQAELRDAILVLVQQTRHDNVILFPPTESAKVTLRLTKATFREALQQLCQHCVPQAQLREHEGLYYIFPRK